MRPNPACVGKGLHAVLVPRCFPVYGAVHVYLHACSMYNTCKRDSHRARAGFKAVSRACIPLPKQMPVHARFFGSCVGFGLALGASAGWRRCRGPHRSAVWTRSWPQATCSGLVLGVPDARSKPFGHALWGLRAREFGHAFEAAWLRAVYSVGQAGATRPVPA